MISYKEPGAYLSVKNSSAGNANGVQMLPCLIGNGATKFQYTQTVIRGAAGVPDLLGKTGVTKIDKIASYSGGPAAFIETTDYGLTTEEGLSYVSWVNARGPAKGEAYYITYTHTAQADQFDVNVIYNAESLIAKYGGDIRTLESGTPVNKLSLAGQLLFQNNANQPIIVCQVASAGETPTKAEFQVGLNKIATREDVWRIVPTVLSADIISALTQHIITFSSYEERKERTGFIGVPYSVSLAEPTEFSGTGGVLDVVGGYATNTANSRYAMPYPDTATYTFSDNVVRKVASPVLMAAFAGAEQAQPISKSRTRMHILGFHTLGGVAMTRAQKNSLAPTGISILEQYQPGADIVVRHGMTTNYTSTQSRELSLVAVQDYCSKSFRSVCEQYIGKYSITNEVLSMIKGTLEGCISTLVKNNIIISGTVETVVQDSENKDAVNVTVRVYVPYPCNYIDITMYVA